MIKAIFWNREQHRLRGGWRLLIQVILFIAVLIPIEILNNVMEPGIWKSLVGSTLYLMAGLSVAWLIARFVDRRSFADYGFHVNCLWWLDLCFGLALGAVLMTGIFLTEYAAGWANVELTSTAKSGLGPVVWFLISLLGFIAIGVNEELVFRGYQLKNLAESFAGKRLAPRAAIALAWLLTSAVFGIAHAANPNATSLSTLNILVAGLLLGLPFLLTGELAMSIGFHVTWNLFQGTVYGFPVSGGKVSRSLVDLRQSGPEEWTGGKFGPEAGLVALIWMLIGCGLIVLWVRARHKRLKLNEQLAHYEARPGQASTTLALNVSGQILDGESSNAE